MGDVWIDRGGGTGWEHLGFAREQDLLYEPGGPVYDGVDQTSLWPPFERIEIAEGLRGLRRQTVWYRPPLP
jgi:hypothetical protein